MNQQILFVDYKTPTVVTVREIPTREGCVVETFESILRHERRPFMEANIVAARESDGKFKMVKNRYAIDTNYELVRFSTLNAMVHYMNAFLADANQPLIKHIDFVCTTKVRVSL